MINQQNTGAYISKLRKAKDWTQLDLANRLHVTHQAVSNWEKGESFPDVAVLPQLARIFGVTVDDLLNGGEHRAAGRVTTGTVVEELARGSAEEVARMVREDPEEGIEAVLQAAPLTKPSLMDRVINNLPGAPFRPEHIIDLAPFVSQEVLQSLLDGVSVDEIDRDGLASLAPFISAERLDPLLVKAAEDGKLDMDTVASVAPFAHRKTLRSLVQQYSEGKVIDWDVLHSLAPFVDPETLSGLIRRLPEGNVPAEELGGLAPFVDKETLNQLVDRVEDGEELRNLIGEVAPFIGSHGLSRLIDRIGADLDPQVIVDIAPFIDRRRLEEFIRRSAGR